MDAAGIVQDVGVAGEHARRRPRVREARLDVAVAELAGRLGAELDGRRRATRASRTSSDAAPAAVSFHEARPVERVTALRDRRQQIASYAENVLALGEGLGGPGGGVRCTTGDVRERKARSSRQRGATCRIARAAVALGSFRVRAPRPDNFAGRRAHGLRPARARRRRRPRQPRRRRRTTPPRTSDTPSKRLVLIVVAARTTAIRDPARAPEMPRTRGRRQDDVEAPVNIPAIVADLGVELEAIQRESPTSAESAIRSRVRRHATSARANTRGTGDARGCARRRSRTGGAAQEEKELSDAYPACRPSDRRKQPRTSMWTPGEGQPVLDAGARRKVLGRSGGARGARGVRRARRSRTTSGKSGNVGFCTFIAPRTRRGDAALAPQAAAHALDSARRAGLADARGSFPGARTQRGVRVVLRSFRWTASS